MPVEYASQTETVKVKIVRNTTIDGETYGPDFKTDVVDVPKSTAIRLKSYGKAIDYVAPKTPKKASKKK